MINYSPVTVAKRFLHTSRAIRHSPLPAKLRAEVQRAMWKLDSAPLMGRSSIDLLGRTISFAGEAPFRHTFAEVFADACYYFETDTDAPIIIDCGSNIGISVLFFKKLYPHAKVVAFEPDIIAFGLLNRNTAGLTELTTHHCALGSADELVDFNRDIDDNSVSLTMSTNPARHQGKTVKVQQRRLSNFIDAPVDLLKIDVEGAERAVMDDLISTNKIAHVKHMHIEYHHHVSGPDELSRFLKQIEDAGFGYQLEADRPTFSRLGSFQDVSLYCYRPL